MAPPTSAELQQIHSILEAHNPLEEDPGGLYELIETLAVGELAALMERAIPPVRLAPNAVSAILRSSIAQLVREAEEGRSRFRS